MLSPRVLSGILLTLIFAALTTHAAPLLSFDDSIDDVFMPGPKVAGVEDAWSLYTNPAGIAYIDGALFMGGYAYRILSLNNGRHLAEGSLGLSILEGLSVGLGLQLSLPQTQIGDDQGMLGGALGVAYRYDRFISLGVRVIKQRQYKNAAADPFLFGIGMQSFPVSWLALGVSVSQVYNDFLANPEIRAGIAIKPFGDLLTVSSETLFWPKDGDVNGDFAVHPELNARLDLGSLSLLASVRANDVTQGFTAPTIFAGIELNFDHLGFGVIAVGRPSDRAVGGGRFRLSSETWPSLAPKRERIVSRRLDSKSMLSYHFPNVSKEKP